MWDVLKNVLDVDESNRTPIMTKIKYMVSLPTTRFTASTPRTYALMALDTFFVIRAGLFPIARVTWDVATSGDPTVGSEGSRLGASSARRARLDPRSRTTRSGRPHRSRPPAPHPARAAHPSRASLPRIAGERLS
jgi:hypothetical protein